MICVGRTTIGDITIGVGNPDWMDKKLNTNLPYYNIEISEMKSLYGEPKQPYVIDLSSDVRFNFIDYKTSKDKVEIDSFQERKKWHCGYVFGPWKLSKQNVQKIFDKCLEIERLSDLSRYTLSNSKSDFRCNCCGSVFDSQLVAEHLCNPKHTNVADRYKEWTNDLIKDDLDKKSYNISVLMSNILGDYNLGSVVRSANALGAREVFYYGKRHVDKRGCVGTHNYTKINYVSIEDILKLKEKYVFVALENNRNYKIENLKQFEWPKNKEILLILGEEGLGISDELLKICDFIVEIPLTGSVRSLNVASACTVALYDFVAKHDDFVLKHGEIK